MQADERHDEARPGPIHEAWSVLPDRTPASLWIDAWVGFALAWWWLCVSPWRSAALGVAGLPVEEAACAIGSAATALFLTANRSSPSRRAAGKALAATATAVALIALAAADAVAATSYWLGVLALSLPIAAGLAAFSARLPESPRGVAMALAAWALGGAAGMASHARLPWIGLPWSLAVGLAGGMVVVAIGVRLGTRDESSPQQSESLAVAAGRRGAAVGALMAWVLVAPDGLGPSPAGWPFESPSAMVWLGAVFGFAAATWGARGPVLGESPLAPAALALAATFASNGSETAATLAAAAAAALLAPAMTTAARRRTALGAFVGCGMALLAMVSGVGPASPVAVLAAAAGFGCAPRSMASWFVALIAASSALFAARPAAPGIEEMQGDVWLAASGMARATWSSSTQDCVLFVHRLESDRSGPRRQHAGLTAAAVALLAPRGPVAVLDAGIGSFASAADECGLGPLWLASPVQGLAAVVETLRVDGPARDPARATSAADLRAARVGSRAMALHAEPGSCAAVVDASLLGEATRSRAACEQHAAMRRAAGDGLTAFAFALDLAPPTLVEAAVGAAAAVHGWCGVFLSDLSVVVVGLPGAPDWELAEIRWRELSAAARWRLHAAGIGSAQDLRDALVRVVSPPMQPAHDDEIWLRRKDLSTSDTRSADNVRVLRSLPQRHPVALAAPRLDALGDDEDAWPDADAALAAAVAAFPQSVLLRQELIRLRIRRADRAILAAGKDSPTQVAEAAALAARFLPFGCPSPALQAALALPDRLGQRLRERRAAAAAAFSIDPAFHDRASPLLQSVLDGTERRTPAADMSRFPSGARLAELAIQEGPLGVLLRVRHASRVAQAIIGEWGKRELSPAALSALREVADPFVLQAAAESLAVRGAMREALRVWRADLPATSSIRALFEGPAGQRQALMVAAAGRKDSGSIALIGRGLVDEDEGVRAAAGAALFRSVGDSIVYDPSWPQDRLREAAARLATLSLHTSR